MDDLKLCKACRWFGERANCVHPAAVRQPDPVFGTPRTWSCTAFRIGEATDKYCGERAGFYEPRETAQAAE